MSQQENTTECFVCKSDTKVNPPKYRCPQCFIRYCSLDCFKLHKSNLAESDYTCEAVQAKKVKATEAENEQKAEQA